MDSVVNIAAYKFVTLGNLPSRKRRMKRLTAELGLKGTILLSEEGINLFLAGSEESIDHFLGQIRMDLKLQDMEVKRSVSSEQPFNRMLVKVKSETIAFGIDEVDPREYTSPRISAEELQQWLDEDRPVVLLDVRNRFEVDAGTFESARQIGIDDFRSFPNAVDQLPEDLKDKPVVTFCTGGIRCEKAAPYLEQVGFREVYQLDGGILKYFEKCGGKHYQGECFVFDKRVALDSSLSETETAQCFACQATLSAADQASPQYVYGESCPHCYVAPQTRMERLLTTRNAQFRQACRPLPGSRPYENVRPVRVPRELEGTSVLKALTTLTHRLSEDEWREICNAGELRRGAESLGPDDTVHAGDRLLHHIPFTVEPSVNPDVQILFEDDALVVVDKPAPLPMHACGRFNKNTLGFLLNQIYSPIRLRPAHRLDANTTGVVVFCKTRKLAAALGPQFAEGRVEKRYLARVLGQPEQEEFNCELPIATRPGTLGTRDVDGSGARAETSFRTLKRMDDGTSLLEVVPRTGRTNQIRIHLWSLGFPIQGDPAYLPNRQRGDEQTLDVEQPPLCLHAQQITIQHPLEHRSVTFQARVPVWAS